MAKNWWSKLKRRSYQYLLWFRPLIYLGLAALLLIFLVWLAPKLIRLVAKLLPGPSLVVSLVSPGINQLESFKGRTNLLLLGTAGGSYPGADLTDSLILLSVNLTTADTVLLSLPRDIWVESLQAKLNSAYHYGETKQPGGGLTLAKAAAAEIIDEPVHYAVLIDFSGFEQAIDILGGITVVVPRGFIDNQYPIPGKETAEPESSRYETVSFSPGEQLMDGKTTLKYVRSRHASGEEGTDYARSQRQQRVILAFKDKLLSARVLLNPKKLASLLAVAKTAIKTDLASQTYADLIKLTFKVDASSIRTGIIDQGSESEDIPALLYNPPVSRYGQWVLMPVNNNWQTIYDYVEEIIYQNQSTTK